ncbi:MAG: hypothetical protein U1F09_05635 [Steroidobacteraceae bacterium]
MRRLDIGVSPPEYFGQNAGLFELLERLYPVQFKPRPPDCTRFGDANIVLGIERAEAVAAAQPDTPCLVCPEARESDNRPKRRDSTFTHGPDVPLPLRGRVIAELLSSHATAQVALTEADTVLAVRDGVPAWMVRRGDRLPRLMDISSVPLPQIADHAFLVDFFGRNESMCLLPLLDFMRRLSNPTGWQAPPPRACIVFDDVNIRASSYGCLQFSQLAAHAAANEYHAAIAMIPLDATRASPETVTLFRDHPRQLSVLVHGNNHQRLELARHRPPAARHALVTQALQRANRFAAQQVLPVDAVMEPPYGTVHVDYLDPLARAGFEAVLVTPRQFRGSNHASAQTSLLGMGPAQMWANGLAIIPRITADTCWRTDVLLASFLQQPIVVAGHHFDADNDLQWVDDVARFVNSVQAHSWQGLSAIARSQFTRRLIGDTLHVRCYSRSVDVVVPDGAGEVVIERPWLDETAREDLHCSAARDDGSSPTLAGRICGPIAVRPRSVLKVRSPHPQFADGSSQAPMTTTYQLRLRRAITESRDRVYPRLPRTFRRKSAIMGRRS